MKRSHFQQVNEFFKEKVEKGSKKGAVGTCNAYVVGPGAAARTGLIYKNGDPHRGQEAFFSKKE